MSMTTRSNHRRDARLLFACWIFLLALTAGSFWIADVDIAPHAATAGVVLGIAALKAHLIAGVFMEMLQAPRAWAIALSGFLVALTGLLIALF
jgi:heme/copper-type cytochrome/quinol oxidase subunit 4